MVDRVSSSGVLRGMISGAGCSQSNSPSGFFGRCHPSIRAPAVTACHEYIPGMYLVTSVFVCEHGMYLVTSVFVGEHPEPFSWPSPSNCV